MNYYSTPFDREQVLQDLGRLPDATNRADLEMMANAIRHLEGTGRLFFAYALVNDGLMIWEDPQMASLVEMAKKIGALDLAMINMFERFPESAELLLSQAIDHCLNGHNKTDSRSAGGWNQRELTLAYAALFVARRGLSVPFGMQPQ